MIQPNFYKTVLRFIRPEVSTIGRIFAFLAESVNENTLLDDVELISKKIIENFIFEGVAEEKIVMGINAIRLIYLRKESALEKEQINYIAAFRNSKSKGVCSSARAFINAVRDIDPEMLDKEY